MFSHVDTDGNGKVDFEEFLRLVKHKEELRGVGRPEEKNTRREDGQTARRAKESNTKRVEEPSLGRVEEPNMRRAEETNRMRAEEANLGKVEEANLERAEKPTLEREDKANSVMFRMFDKDQSGSLSRQEWEAVRSKETFDVMMMMMMIRIMVMMTILMLPLLCQVMSLMGLETSPSEAAQLFSTVDRDGDGRIGINEFVTYLGN